MAPCEALYGQKCRTPLCLTKLVERKLLGPEVVQESEGKIKFIYDRLKATSDRQKSMLGMKGNLSLRFIGPYQIFKRVDQLHISLNYLQN
ncbi:reverse transcriptase [Gossypium australe]|uniref:Reverse transcriptase n=1 Tax=Gossypium australe TaxID=47621 RepID=A0A5B6WU16_9ROSI|nr:reverse transcriptase [Gossypium australe]